MAEQSTSKNALTCYIASDGRAVTTGDGSRDHPFASLSDAFESRWAEQHPQSSTNGDVTSVDFVCLADGAASESTATADHTYYYGYNDQDKADGSPELPWPDLQSAIEGLGELAKSNQVSLKEGRSIRLVRMEMFVPSPLERRKFWYETIAKYILMMMAISCVLPVVAILGYLVYRAYPALSWEFLTKNPENYFTAGGIWAPMIGTFFVVLLSLLIAAPIGVLAGVYLNEYARDNWFTRLINLAVVNLAGVPSIVHALFGVGAFVLFMGMGRSLLAASCTVAVMTLPVIITSTREALAAVPMAFREACWNMGASKWQTIRTIVLPNSIAGILTGVILQVSRAAGETAPILFTGAVLFVPVADSGWESVVPYGPQDRFMALSYHLYALSTQIRGAPEETLFATAVVLIGLVLVVNSVSILFRIYLRTRKKW